MDVELMQLLERIAQTHEKMSADIAKSQEQLAASLREITDYIAALRSRTTTAPPADPRYPYLAGRQPRRDGDSYGTRDMNVAQASGAGHVNDQAGTLRITRLSRD